MKNLTRILSSLSLILAMAFSARSQDVFKIAPVGIGTVNPAQALDVAGNIKFSNALMPGGIPGSAGNLLMSSGNAPATPTWLGNGTSGYVLTMAGGVPTWASPYANVWNLTGGNAISATYGANFMGTLNDVPLEFKTQWQSTPYSGVIDPIYQNVYFGGDINSYLSNGGNPGNDASALVVGAKDNVAIGGAALAWAQPNLTSYDVMVGYATGASYEAPNSVGIGQAALRWNTTGTPETAFGQSTLKTSGSSGTAIGAFNSAFGYSSHTDVSSGTKNTSVGPYSLFAASTSSSNTAVGYYALYSSSTGEGNNTAIGYYAAYLNTTGHSGTSIGYEANYANSTNYGNTAIGANALYTNTYAKITAVGTNAFKSYNNATADPGVAIGDSAGYANTNYFSTLIGSMAGMNYGQTSGNANGQLAAVGYAAVKNFNGNSAQSTGFGWMAATTTNTATTTIYSFTAVGPMAMGNGIVTGIGNTAIGAAAMANVSSGGDNVAIGSNNSVTSFTTATLGTLTTGGYNVAIGYNAASATNGSYNVAIGINTNIGSSTQSGNTAIGYEAAATGGITTVASGSTALGANAQASASNSTAIGANAVANTANTFILGGTGANAVSVGIGTNTPAQELEIGGTINTIEIDGIRSTGSYASSSTNSNSNILYTNNATGDVYALPNGSSGQVLTLSSGVPTWVSPQVYSATSPLSIISNNLSISGTNGGAMYGTGSGVAFTAAGNVLNILTEDPISGLPKFDTIVPSALSSHDLWGSQSVVTDSSATGGLENTITGNGLPAYPLKLSQQSASIGQVLAWNGTTWKPSSVIATLSTYNIAPAGGSAITVANGTGQVVGGSNVTLDLRGTSGGLLEGNGSSSATFTSGGTNGYIYTYTGVGASSWQPSTAPVAWSLTGNSGTNPSINFIGTTDDKQFRFYVTGQSGSYNGPAGSLDPQFVGATAFANVYLGGPNTNNSNTNGPGNNDAGSYNVGLGFGAMGFATSASTYDVAVGSHALEFNPGSYDVTFGYGVGFNGSSPASNGFTELGSNGNQPPVPGSYATFVGYATLTGASAGLYNTTLGYASMFGSTSGQSNTAIGTRALYNTTVSHNTAVGDSALYTNTSGANNTALGYGAGIASATLTNAISIGYQASTTANNSITLGNAAVLGGTSTSPLTSGLYIPGYNTTGSLFYTSAASGFVSSLTPGTSTYLLQSNGPGNVPTWNNVTITPGTVTNVLGDSAIVVNGTWNVNIEGIAPSNGDKGGVLYSTGPGNSASFTLAGTTGQLLTSMGTSAPTWTTLPTNSWNVAGGNTISSTYGTNYFGTTTANAPLYIKQYTSGGNTNAVEVTGLIDPNNQNIYFGGIVNGASPGVIGAVANVTVGAINNVAIGNGSFGNAPNCCTTYTPLPVGASNDIFIGYGTGLAFGSVSSNNGDVAIGNSSIRYATTSSTPITAFGRTSFQGTSAGVAGVYNTALGNAAESAHSSGTKDVAAGQNALHGGTSASNNTGLGYNSLYTNTTGGNNTAAGYYALEASNGTNSVAIGYDALLANTTSSNNTALGYNALATATTSGSNTAIGTYAAKLTNASRNVAMGDSALYTNTSGANNTAIGYFANVFTSGLSNATVIGANASATASNSVTLGTSSTSLYLPKYNSTGSLFYTAAANGQVLGTGAGTSGYLLQSNGPNAAPTWANVTPGAGSVTSVTANAPLYVSGTWTVGIQGNSLGTDKGGVLYSAGAGNPAVFTTTGTSGNYLESQGASAPIWVSPASVYGTLAWGLAGNGGTNPAVNFLGTTNPARLFFETGTTSVLYAGSVDMGTATLGANGFANVYMGTEGPTNGSLGGAGNGDNGSYNVAFGYGTMGNVSAPTGSGVTATASYNVAVGTFTLRGLTTGSHNIAFGYGAVPGNGASGVQTSIGTIGIGGAAGHFNLNGNYDTYLGSSAGYSNTSGNFNTSAGVTSLYSASTAVSNTDIGFNSGYYLTTGGRNTAAGDSTFIGTGTANGNLTTGTNNVALGFQATVGNASTSGAAFTNSIAIGYQATTPASNSISLGNASDVGGTTSATTTGVYMPGYSSTGSLFYIAGANGHVASTGAGTSGYYLQSNGLGVAPTWANVTGSAGTVTTVGGDSSIVVSNVGSVWTAGIQGNNPNTDKGGVLYSQGGHKGAIFTPTPASAGLILTSSAGGAAPTWTTYTTPVASTWQITGNGATIPGTNFLGTTDANRLNFRDDAVTAGSIDLPTTLGGNGNAYYGYGTGYLNNGTAASGASYGDVGLDNTAIGWAAFHDPDYTGPGTASYNIAIGFADINGAGQPTGAGIAGQTGSYNVGTGYNNLYELTTGNGNISLANKSGHGIQVGNYNTGFGYFSFGNTNANYIGSYNVAAGYYSQIATGGSPNYYNSNTSVGFYALNTVQYGRNTAAGSYTLNSNVSGIDNTAVGDSAFTGIAFTNTVPYNTAFGNYATATAATLSNVTSIGFRADVGQSNAMVLGSITGVNNTGFVTGNINVGIGTNTPATDAAIALKSGHLESQGQLTSANIFATTFAGTGATASVITGTGATDISGSITLTTGTGTYSSGAQAVVSFATAYLYSPIIVLSPGNAAAAAAMTANKVYVASNTSGFYLNFGTAPSSSQTYVFNYFAIETPNTIAVTETAPVSYPSYTETCVVPITLTNSQSTATPVGFQQMVTVNSSLYSNEMSGLQNIVFTTAAPVAGVTQGTVLNAWIESGNSSSSTSTVYWVDLGAKTIPANSSGTIYMNIVTANVLSAAGPTGEAPQLPGTYAQYDNGPFVFGALAYTPGNYWNFAGTGNPSGLTKASPNTYGTIGFNNLCTLAMTTTGQWGNYLASSSTITPGSTGIVAETDANNSTPYPTTVSNAMLSGLIVGTSATFANTVSYAVTLSNQITQDGITMPLNTYNFDVQSGYEQTVFPYPIIGYLSPSNTNYNIYSLGINSSGNLGFGDVNYTNLVQTTPNTTNNLSAGFYIGLGTTQDNSYFQWLRTRIYPPNAVMPSVSAASETCP